MKEGFLFLARSRIDHIIIEAINILKTNFKNLTVEPNDFVLEIGSEWHDGHSKFLHFWSHINDMPFTAVCDWIENCEYECKPKINVNNTFKRQYNRLLYNRL